MPSFELRPSTESGRQFVEACEQCAATFADRAAAADKAGKFPLENAQTLKQCGLIGAAVPIEFGGWGVDSVHDLAVGIDRLGRGDGSMAIAYTMHVTITWAVARFWSALGLDTLRQQLTAIVGGEIIGIGATEAGTSVLYPQTTAEPIDEGWRINGRKIFGTLSPVADRFVVAVKVISDQDHPLTGNAFVARDTPGLTILDNWDALGMRASGSNDLVFENVVVGADDVIPGSDWGTWDAINLTSLLVGNAVVIAASLGIAETARDEVVRMLQTRRKFPDADVLATRPALQHGVAEMEIALFGMRAALDRITRLADDEITARGPFDVELADLHQLMKELQCAKSIVNRKAIEIVDKAMTLSGGAGFFSSNILSRLYRDVRAGPFMQPFSPNEAFEYIGRLALGLEPF